jgi:hypothetical protein
MINKQIITEIKNEIINITYFSFHVEESADDGGKTIDIYAIDDDIREIQSALSRKFGKARLIFYAMEEEDILHLHDKNM